MPKSVCVLLLGTALLSCSDQKEIQITGTVRNLNGGMIVYQQSIAGMMNTKTIDTLQIQSDGTFTLTLPVEDYERVNFHFVWKSGIGFGYIERRKNTIGCRCNGSRTFGYPGSG